MDVLETGPGLDLVLPDDDDGPRIHEFMTHSVSTGAQCLGVAPRNQHMSGRSSSSISHMTSLEQRKCCKRDCLNKLASHPSIFELRKSFQNLDKEAQQQWLYNRMLELGKGVKTPSPGHALRGFGFDVRGDQSGCGPGGCSTDAQSGCGPPAQSGCGPPAQNGCGPPESNSQNQSNWKLAGHDVCFRAWYSLLSVGSGRVRQVLHALESGSTRPYTDQRKHNSGREPEVQRNVDAFLEFAYQHMAEPLADATIEIADQKDDKLPDDVEDTSEGMMQDLVVACVKDKPTKYLAPGSVTDLYDSYCQFERGGAAASEATFRRTLKEWSGCLKFRRLSQHAKCTICGKLQKLRKDATNEQERQHYQKELEVHLQGMFRDRAVDARIGKLSEESAHGSLVQSQGVLSIAMDGMDQA